MDGEGRSWTFPVYIIHNELADGFPGDEDELPADGGFIFKGLQREGVLAANPSLQQFVDAAMDEQVAVEKLTVEEHNNTDQSAPALSANAGVEDEAN
ncbi:hypothetical protein GUJ93_ZPchr0002g23497 [Zizania palustris]|uniref:Uncharacterized protein n=1 Tax=Zizania palustris TaxID=103762 RepID=A0A8J5S3A3_ZIZPA|nr:hypothetical protein GUJ93_ZPchr0002g23497 [Zizania palustris]